MSALTEQEQLEFNQAADRVRSVGMAVISQSEYAEKAISFYEHVHFNLDQVISVAFESTPQAMCQVGCDHCCKNRKIEVTMPEAFYIAEQIKKMPAITQAELFKTLSQSVKATKEQKPPEACTFLKERKCTIYQVRPSVCRKAHSQSVEACANDQDIPQHLGALIGAEAMMLGTKQAFEALGYLAEVEELNLAVYNALTSPNALTEWYKAFLDKQKALKSSQIASDNAA